MILMGAGPKMNKYEPQHQVLISFFLYIVFHIFFSSQILCQHRSLNHLFIYIFG
jgi:membrane-bound acyltransferase YfiQ involved in biofilm formation